MDRLTGNSGDKGVEPCGDEIQVLDQATVADGVDDTSRPLQPAAPQEHRRSAHPQPVHQHHVGWRTDHRLRVRGSGRYLKHPLQGHLCQRRVGGGHLYLIDDMAGNQILQGPGKVLLIDAKHGRAHADGR